MADQRRGESAGHRRGRAGRLARLALAGLLLTTACQGHPRDPTGIGGPGTGIGNGTGQGGTGGGQEGGALLVGAWVNIQLFRTDQDLIRVTTTWTFQASGDCSRSIENFSLALGYPLTTVTGCTWSMSGSDLAVSFTGTPGAAVFRVSTVNFSRNQVDIGGNVFDRQS